MVERVQTSGFGGLGQSFLAARPLDRIGLLTIMTSLYFFQYWGLSLNDFTVWPYDRTAKLGLIAISIVGVLVPRLWPLMFANAFAYVTAYVAAMPVASNNQTTAMFVCAIILVGAVLAVVQRDSTSEEGFRERIFDAIAGPGRYILAIMYFYGIYHKINTDFLDPEVSCAVVLYRPLMEPFALQDWALGHQAAIYTTFVVEFVAMVLLFSPRYKRIGMLIGIPFHVAIGWTGYAYYKDFSTIVLCMYAMFMTKEVLDNANAHMAKVFGNPARASELGRLAVFVIFGAYLAMNVIPNGSEGLIPTHETYTWLFTVYGVIFPIFALLYVPMRMSDPATDLAIRPAWLAILPVIFFINGASPYLGLKTESSIAMFSNLYTEDNETNHLFHGQLPFAANYQNDIIVPLSSNSDSFSSRFIGYQQGMVRYEFDRAITAYPDLEVEFLHNGTPRTLDDTWVNTYAASNGFMQKYLVFKPIDFARPHPCTH